LLEHALQSNGLRFNIPTQSLQLSEFVFMRRILLGLSIIPVSLLAGCGGSSLSGSAPTAPHGGIMAEIPGGKGFAEVMVGTASGGKGVRKGQQVKSEIAAYFYQADGTTEMSPPPTDVKVKVGTGAGSPTFGLAPQPKEKGKFASEPAELPEGFRGQLEATVNGEPVSVGFAIR
jgi:hypothetical protein